MGSTSKSLTKAFKSIHFGLQTVVWLGITHRAASLSGREYSLFHNFQQFYVEHISAVFHAFLHFNIRMYLFLFVLLFC